MNIVRLRAEDVGLARATFAMMPVVFAEDEWARLSDSYLTGLLALRHVWAYAAVVDGEPIGGLTAHQLPMTRAQGAELLIYDLAVRADRQRLGIGRALVQKLLDDAAAVDIGEVWVPADNDDTHALEFYRRTGGAAQAVTIFTFPTG